MPLLRFFDGTSGADRPQGIDYQVYFCVALFVHLRDTLKAHYLKQHVWQELLQSPIKGFSLPGSQRFLKRLCARYRSFCVPTMKSALAGQLDDTLLLSQQHTL